MKFVYAYGVALVLFLALDALWLGVIAQVFPDAKILLALRDLLPEPRQRFDRRRHRVAPRQDREPDRRERGHARQDQQRHVPDRVLRLDLHVGAPQRPQVSASSASRALQWPQRGGGGRSQSRTRTRPRNAPITSSAAPTPPARPSSRAWWPAWAVSR